MTGADAARLPNPLIPGFNPDPSCVRVGDAFYLVTSTFEYLPALPIYRSTDFATWEHIGDVTADAVQAGIVDARSGMGVWAPTIRHRDGVFYVIVCVAASDRGCVVFSATDPAGPWSDGLTLPGVDGIDPDLAWDEHGTAFVTYSALRLRGDEPGRHDGIEQVAVDLVTGETLSEPRPLWSGSGLQFPEAPHLYRREGQWYLLIAEGGTERGHAVSIARGPSISGPFEGCPANPVLSASGTDRPIQNTGHADLVAGPGGSDLAVVLGVRPLGSAGGFSPLGRETFVTAVEWVDGWPVIAPVELAPRDGIVEEHFDLRSPADLAEPGWLAVGRTPAQLATFDADGLTLRGEGGGLDARLPVLLGRRQRHLDSDTAVRVRPGTGAGGLGLRFDEDFHIGLTARADDAGGLRVSATAAVRGLRQTWEQTVDGDEVTLRIRTRRPVRLMANDGAGADRVLLEIVAPDGAVTRLAELDGRYWSAETAAYFTGRIVGPFAERGAVRFRDVVYRGGDGAHALEAPEPSRTEGAAR
ncbi:family 43 glycosylhydrolase [Leifsonia aquatica]|uniref:glycoside hydrolase family 43 protein n=1 Tax=Leifsonia aquatica TaxID=144185 RepID=UPI00384CAEF3